MDKARNTQAYIDGVEKFIDFSFSHSTRGNTILCPCRICLNCCWFEAQQSNAILVERVDQMEHNFQTIVTTLKDELQQMRRLLQSNMQQNIQFNQEYDLSHSGYGYEGGHGGGYRYEGAHGSGYQHEDGYEGGYGGGYRHEDGYEGGYGGGYGH